MRQNLSIGRLQEEANRFLAVVGGAGDTVMATHYAAAALDERPVVHSICIAYQAGDEAMAAVAGQLGADALTGAGDEAGG